MPLFKFFYLHFFEVSHKCPAGIYATRLSDYAFIPLTSDLDYMEKSQKLHRMSHLFLIMKKHRHRIEGYFFTTPELDHQKCAILLNQIDLLNKFGLYFKREAKLLIENIYEEGYNMHEAKGSAFLQRDQCLPLSNTDKNTVQFLKKTTLLSFQEQECLDLFKQGNSAQSSAAIMNFSRCTVEHYFENIKDKLGCHSKRELLEW